MKENSFCPICANKDLRLIAQQNFKVQPDSGDFSQSRMNVLLKDVINREQMAFSTMICKDCRAIFFTPTFSPEQVTKMYSPEITEANEKADAKAEGIAQKSWAQQRGILERMDSLAFQDEMMQQRAENLYSLVDSLANKPVTKVLDIGGGDGSLLKGFVHSKKYILDISRDAGQVNDLTFLSGTAEAKAQGPYDLIVLSHILEHVLDPVGFVQMYKQMLSEQSLIYVEVPIEYVSIVLKKKCAPIGQHLTFFCKRSLIEVMNRCSMQVKYMKSELINYRKMATAAIKAVMVLPGAPSENHSSKNKYPSYYLDLVGDIFLMLKKRFSSR